MGASSSAQLPSSMPSSSGTGLDEELPCDEVMLLRLAEFKARFGNTVVPREYWEDSQLAAWLHRFRTIPKYIHSIDLIRQLDELGFSWNVETVLRGMARPRALCALYLGF